MVVTDPWDGVCMISSKNGTVCLIQNAAANAINTYRVNTTKWAAAVTAGSVAGGTHLTVIQNLNANVGAYQDPTQSNVQTWFDSFYCTGGTGTYICTGFQPDWMGGVSQGYPRMGVGESQGGELTYFLLAGNGSGTFESFEAADIKEWLMEGAATLGASALAISLALYF